MAGAVTPAGRPAGESASLYPSCKRRDAAEVTDIRWHKSSYSEQAANCLELTVVDGEALVRESDEPDAVVRTTRAELAAFLAGAKAGGFDELL